MNEIVIILLHIVHTGRKAVVLDDDDDYKQIFESMFILVQNE